MARAIDYSVGLHFRFMDEAIVIAVGPFQLLALRL